MSEPEAKPLSIEEILTRPGSTWTQVECEVVFEWLLQSNRYRQLLFSALRFLGKYATREDAEDAVGDFLLKKIHSVAQSFDPAKAPFWNFLILCLRQFCYGVTRQARVMYLVKGQDEQFETSPECIVDSSVNIHQSFENKDTIRKAIEALPRDLASVFTLHYFQDKKIEAVARELGIKGSTAKVRLFRARQLLSELIKGRGNQR